MGKKINKSRVQPKPGSLDRPRTGWQSRRLARALYAPIDESDGSMSKLIGPSPPDTGLIFRNNRLPRR